MMNAALDAPTPLPEMQDMTAKRFWIEILPAGRPVMLRSTSRSV
jgi:hypothetical protein